MDDKYTLGILHFYEKKLLKLEEVSGKVMWPYSLQWSSYIAELRPFYANQSIIVS